MTNFVKDECLSIINCIKIDVEKLDECYNDYCDDLKEDERWGRIDAIFQDIHRIEEILLSQEVNDE